MTEQMATIRKDRLQQTAKALTPEEQAVMITQFETSVIWNEAERRLKEALELQNRINKAVEKD